MRQQLTGLLFVLCVLPAAARDLPINLIKLPAGFHIELYTGNVPNARSMSMSPSGVLFVGSRHAGKVYAIKDSNRDGRGDQVYVIAEGLNMPNGVAFRDGALYVAEVNRILRFDDIEQQLHQPPKPAVVSTDFPADQHHGWKFIRIGPDHKLYVPIGAPCNVCIEYGYAAITRLNLDGSDHESYAQGVRNTVGFDWHPDTKELWFTDNGRDMLGDDLPADELNRAPHEGMHFGFPYCHGGDVLDPDFGLGHGCNEYVTPVQKLGAHVASLGMRFYTGKMFPPKYRKHIFIAEHGSWNRSEKTGYRVTLVRLKGNKAISYEPFAEGWLQGQKAWGRPVDIEHMEDGSLLVSDDMAGAIYRIYYDGLQTNTIPVNNTEKLTTDTDNKPEVNILMEKQPQRAPVKPIPVNQADRKSDSIKKPARPVQTAPPEDIHESLLFERQSESEHPKAEKPNRAYSNPTIKPEQKDVPPPHLIEKIRARTEQNSEQPVDPFSPLNKQTVNQ